MPVILQGVRQRWTLGRRLLEGGQANVQEAHAHDFRAAVKRPRTARAAADLRVEASAMQELAASSRDASWLVPVVDTGTDEAGRPFYVMPWYDQTLKDLLGAPLLDRLDLLVQAAGAVRRLHAASRDDVIAIHRDLKPSNLLVEPVGPRLRLRLADFGAVRQQELFTEQTNTVVFTEGYAPPEQRLPLPGEPDASVDVFALAAVVFHVLTGEQPPVVSCDPERSCTAAGRELFGLMRVGPLGAHRERFDQLRKRPVTDLIDKDAPALGEDERAALRNRVEDGLAASRRANGGALPASRSAGLADEVEELLVPVLDQALRPCPRVRQGDASRMWDALKQVHDLIAGELGQPAWAPIPPGAAAHPGTLAEAGPGLAEELAQTDARPPQAMSTLQDGLVSQTSAGELLTSSPIAAASSGPQRSPFDRRWLLLPLLCVGPLVWWALPPQEPSGEPPAAVGGRTSSGAVEASVDPSAAPEGRATVGDVHVPPVAPQTVSPVTTIPPRPAMTGKTRPDPVGAAARSEEPTLPPVEPPPRPPPARSCVTLSALASGGVVTLGGTKNPRSKAACDGEELRVSYTVNGEVKQDTRTLRLDLNDGEGRWRLGSDSAPVKGGVLSLRWSLVGEEGRWKAAGG